MTTSIGISLAINRLGIAGGGAYDPGLYRNWQLAGGGVDQEPTFHGKLLIGGSFEPIDQGGGVFAYAFNPTQASGVRAFLTYNVSYLVGQAFTDDVIRISYRVQNLSALPATVVSLVGLSGMTGTVLNPSVPAGATQTVVIELTLTSDTFSSGYWFGMGVNGGEDRYVIIDQPTLTIIPGN